MQATRPAWPAASAADFVDSLLRFLQRAGESRYDEAVSQLEHALQTAHLAVRARDSDHAIAAALLHDIGHLLLAGHDEQTLSPDTDLEHEVVGARWLARMFPQRVTDPIREHVRAKRYLCAIDTGYHRRLSSASRRSLALQGGTLPESERASVDLMPHFADAVTLRRRDDAGKVAGKAVPGLETYRALLESLVRG